MTVISPSLRKAFTSNQTTNGFDTLIPKITEPSGDGVFDLWSRALGVGIDGHIPRYIDLIPYGTNADNETHNLRLWIWSKVVGEELWIPELLLQLAVTLGNIDGSVIGTGVLMADTIAITYGDTAAPSTTNAADLTASILCHLRGCRYIQFDTDIGTGDALNCFWRTMDQK